MADPADEFRSSDIEVEEVPDAFAGLGASSLARALQNATEDRKSTKIAYKQRPKYYGSPGTQMAQAIWGNRFRGFLSTTLHVGPGTMPTVEHIIRFIYAFPEYISARSPSGMVSWSTLTDGIARVIKSIQFTHPDFRVKSGEAAQIKAVLADLLNKNVITKDRGREARWISSRLVFLITTAYIQNAADHGCRTWDYVLQGALGLSLMLATGGRSGDLAKSVGWKGDQFAKYRDFAVTLVEDEAGNEVFECVAALRYTKGYKDSANVQHTVKLKLLSNEFNSCDAIKLLIVMALRTGNVDETSIEALLNSTRQRRNKTIMWKDGSLPVLKAADPGHALKLDVAAPESQLRRVLQQAAALVGVLAVPGTHDMRRGTAFEMHNLPSTEDTGSEERARNIMGHTHKAAFKGITSNYIGGARSSLLEERLQTDWSRSNMTAAHSQAPRIYKEPEITTTEVDRYLQSKNQYTKNEDQRRKARRHMTKAHREEWQKENDPFKIDVVDPNKDDQDEIPIDPRLIAPTLEPRKRRVLPWVNNDERITSASPVPSGKRRRAAESDASGGKDGSEEQTNPLLQHFVESINSGTSLDIDMFDQDMFDQDMFDLEPVNAAADHTGAHSHVEDPFKPSASNLSTPQPLTSSCFEFIDYYSRVNIQLDEVVPSTGGSKDAPVTYQYHCSKQCGYSNTKRVLVVLHARECTGKPYSRPVADIPCSENCGKMYVTEKIMKEHVRTIHRFTPKPCPRVNECDQTVLYDTQHKLNYHKTLVHKPRFSCPYCRGTPSEAKTYGKQSLKRHLSLQHGVSGEAFKAMLKGETGNDRAEEEEEEEG
ncbi:unnamed protein product [Alternaria alternata]